MEKIIRQRIMFYGRVQGIGFRYRLKYAASARGLTGWVKNRYDGSVEAEVQGKREEISSLVAAMEDIRFIRIDKVVRTDIPVEEKEYHFHIK